MNFFLSSNHRPPFGILWLAVLLLAASNVLGHDFWIEPQSYAPGKGETVPIYLLVGDHFKGELFPRSASHIESFVSQTPLGRLPVEGFEGRNPAGYLMAAKAGHYVIGYRSSRSFTSMKVPAFNDYLREEGLAVFLQRESEEDLLVREAFSRCAKALLKVDGETTGGPADTALGLELELVARQNPHWLKAGDWLDIQLLYQGRPLEGALLTARPKEAPGAASSSRSDSQGLTRLQITRGGIWMIKTVHMIPAAEGLDADWESLWATLTFEVGD